MTVTNATFSVIAGLYRLMTVPIAGLTDAHQITDAQFTIGELSAPLLTKTLLSGAITASAVGGVLQLAWDMNPADTIGLYGSYPFRVDFVDANGEPDCATQGTLIVTVPSIERGVGALCTLQQVKDRAGIATSKRDTMINELIPVVLARLNQSLQRELMWNGTAQTRTYETTSHHLTLIGSDLRNCTSVVMDPNGQPYTCVPNQDYLLRLSQLTGTATSIHLSEALYLGSDFTRRFGVVQVAVTGDWGIWQDLSQVPPDVNEAAIECVLAWIDKPVATAANIDSSNVREVLPQLPTSFDIPSGAWRKLQPYNRNFGVF